MGGIFAKHETPEPTPPKPLPHLKPLASALDGSLFAHGDDGYEAARLGQVWTPDKCQPGAGRKFSPETHPTETWNKDAAKLPAAIAQVASVSDVAACVRYCRAAKIPCGVACGRHSHECLQQDSFVVDLQNLRNCELGERQGVKVLRCEGGALNGDAYQALDGSGLCITLGQHPGTGCGGLVQQGGHGIAEKVLGLSIDALVECTVVTADGATVKASSAENADLFWALRGGCGNFGVVVEFVFEPKPFRQMVPSLQRVHLPIPFLCPSREELVKRWRDNVESAPRDVYPMMVCTPMPTIEVFHGVGDGATLESLAGYENFGRPVVSDRKERDFFREISWDSLGPSSTDNLAGLYYPTASLLKEMPDEACRIVANAAKTCPASATLILTPCGGAAAEVPKDATAVYHRDVTFWIVAAAGWKASTFRSEAAAREEAVAWARELRDALMPYTCGRDGLCGNQ